MLKRRQRMPPRKVKRRQRMSLERHRQQMLGRQKQELKGALPNEQQRRRCVDKPWGSLPTSLFPMWSRALAPKVCSETQLHALSLVRMAIPHVLGGCLEQELMLTAWISRLMYSLRFALINSVQHVGWSRVSPERRLSLQVAFCLL